MLKTIEKQQIVFSQRNHRKREKSEWITVP